MSTSDDWPKLQLIVNLSPWDWRGGLHWDWSHTRTIVVDLGPITLTYFQADPDEHDYDRTDDPDNVRWIG